MKFGIENNELGANSFIPTNIENSNLADIDEIFRLYTLATEYQKVKFPGNQWPKFERSLIANEIAESRQFKLLIDQKIACIWVIAFHDVQIWEEKDLNDAIYIHRIATNPEFRGYNFVNAIVDWAKVYAKNVDKQFVRLDTCGNNDRLINHYKKCGFNFLGMKKLNNTSDLPSHYQNADVCFFEIEVA